MERIILYYKYVNIENPDVMVSEQRNICQELGLKGRIIIAHEGINGTLGGPIEALEQYKASMDDHPLFSAIDFKESEGSADHFPRLKVIKKNEIVHLGLDQSEANGENTGTYLLPQEAHDLMSENPDDLVILDTRNEYEWRVGTFKNALKPHINNFRELPNYIDENGDLFKDKQVLMFCTGGVRCERATAYLNVKKVAKKVYQIKGGIHRYAEEFPDGHFRGKNYVFDGRVTVPVTDDILASCEHCAIPYDDYNNCINAECNKQIIVCPPCITEYHNTCSKRCMKLVQASKVNIRTLPHKILIKTQNI